MKLWPPFGLLNTLHGEEIETLNKICGCHLSVLNNLTMRLCALLGHKKFMMWETLHCTWIAITTKAITTIELLELQVWQTRMEKVLIWANQLRFLYWNSAYCWLEILLESIENTIIVVKLEPSSSLRKNWMLYWGAAEIILNICNKVLDSTGKPVALIEIVINHLRNDVEGAMTMVLSEHCVLLMWNWQTICSQ